MMFMNFQTCQELQNQLERIVCQPWPVLPNSNGISEYLVWEWILLIYDTSVKFNQYIFKINFLITQLLFHLDYFYITTTCREVFCFIDGYCNTCLLLLCQDTKYFSASDMLLLLIFLIHFNPAKYESNHPTKVQYVPLCYRKFICCFNSFYH